MLDSILWFLIRENLELRFCPGSVLAESTHLEVSAQIHFLLERPIDLLLDPPAT